MLLCNLLMAAVFSASTTDGSIVCEGAYEGHVQGVDTDGTNIWWSFTSVLVRTDLSGHVLARTDAPRHQGDLCIRGNRLYVAVNRGKFNQITGGISEVMAYEASTLRHVKTWPIDMPHGAGGMTEHNGRFYVVGGLPGNCESNYVYEYDTDFRLVQRHELATGFTLMGIQTASVIDGRLCLGIYGDVGNPEGVIVCSPDFSSFTRHVGRGAAGMIRLSGVDYTAMTATCDTWMRHPKTGKMRRLYRAKLIPDPTVFSGATIYRPSRTNQGYVRVFFEADGTNDWFDAGYELSSNGYRPLFLPGKLTVFEPVDAFCAHKTVPAVGIGGSRAYSAPDLVRAVRRCAEKDEAFALHVPGTAEDVAKDPRLSAVLEAVRRACDELGVRYEGHGSETSETRVLHPGVRYGSLTDVTRLPVACRSVVVVANEHPSLLPDGKEFRLVWHDEFKGAELDASKWSYRTNFWGQRFAAFAGPEDDCVVVGDGVLRLKIGRRADGQYMSPQLQTGELMWDIPWMTDRNGFWPLPKREKAKFEHRYGYYECRCRLQRKSGWWSAFWMQSSAQGTCLDPSRAGIEHDIMESFAPGCVDPHMFHMNGYGPDYKGYSIPREDDKAQGRTAQTLDMEPDVFHTFGLLWEPDGYSVFVDGRQHGNKSGGRLDEPVSHVPEFILLTTECQWYRNDRMTGGGVRELEDAFVAMDDFVIDYVRVFDVVSQ